MKGDCLINELSLEGGNMNLEFPLNKDLNAMSQFENSQQRKNFGKIVLTSFDFRGFEWLKRVSNFVVNDMGSLRNIQLNI